MGENLEARRRAATRAFVRYFALAFLVVLGLSALSVYAVLDSRAQKREARAIRIEYCAELEALKAQNREDVAKAKRDYPRTLRLLGLKDTKELRDVAEEGWALKLARNAPKSCPYTGRT